MTDPSEIADEFGMTIHYGRKKMTLVPDIQDELKLIALASKAALVAETNGIFDNPVEQEQFIEAAKEVRPILARLDETQPGFIPVPHDGVPWKDRT